MNPTLLII